jgi:hypothetical protein
MSDVVKPPVAPWEWGWVETAAVVTVGVALLIAVVTQEDVNWLTQLPSFVGSLWSHWVVLLTGGVTVLALGFWERQYRQIGFSQYLALTIAAIIPAAYLSWIDEHQSRVQAEAQLASYNNAAALRQRFIDENLAKVYAGTQSFLHEKITADNFSDWSDRVNAFADGAGSWIQETMGNAAMMKFQDMNGPRTDFAGITISPEHTDVLNWLSKVSINLQAMMHNPMWDAGAPKPPELSRGP